MRIWIDAGHGGSDPGAVSRITEKEYTLAYALELGRVLTALGFIVGYTRADDGYVSLANRAAVANAWDADYFISIHFNAGGGTGIETFAMAAGGRGEQLAKAVQSALVEQTGVVNRGVKFASYQVLRETNMPAILIEGGFVDSTDADKIKTEDYKRNFIRGVSKGICAHMGVAWRDYYDDTGPVQTTDLEFTPPSGANIWPLPGGLGWIETLDKRLIIHLSRSTYISMEDGKITHYERGK